VNVTGFVLDSGLFKTPTLRNVALSAPYMHDGRFSSLEEVVEHYNSGGVSSSTIDAFMKYTTGGLELAPQQKEALIAFLHALTDTTFVQNPNFHDPH
jgi:cytochrome c peroxidase